jgi:hypothetical protein
MAKNMTVASPDIQEMVQNIAKEFGLENVIDFQVMNKFKAKEVVKVQVANPLVNTLTSKEVVVFVYEDAFDRVDDVTKMMWLKSELNKISYDFEKDKVTISNKVVSVHLDFYQTYGKDAIDKAELGLHIIEQLEEEEKQRKAEAKESKKSKKKKY